MFGLAADEEEESYGGEYEYQTDVTDEPVSAQVANNHPLDGIFATKMSQWTITRIRHCIGVPTTVLSAWFGAFFVAT